MLSTESTLPRRRPGWKSWVLMGFLGYSLLGLGERCLVDLRLVSPSATLGTYWKALRDADEASAAACLVEGEYDLPHPGQLWFLPPTRRLELTGFRSLPVSAGRVLVTYEVRYLPEGSAELQIFRTGHELVRERGEWRILRPLGEASLPEWRAIRRAVDS